MKRVPFVTGRLVEQQLEASDKTVTLPNQPFALNCNLYRILVRLVDCCSDVPYQITNCFIQW